MKFLTEYIDERNKNLIDLGIDYQKIEGILGNSTEADLMDKVSIVIRCNNEERWIGHTINLA